MCPYCGQRLSLLSQYRGRPSKDHILPRSRFRQPLGGSTVSVCRRCNGDKGNLTLSEWVVRLLWKSDPRAIRVARFIEKMPWWMI